MKANWYYLLARRVANYNRRSVASVEASARTAYFYVLYVEAVWGDDVLISTSKVCFPSLVL